MKKSLVLGVLTVLMFACASDTNKNIEEAQFALDHGEFAHAIELVKPVLEVEPDNNEAKFILGSAYIGKFALNPKPGCEEDDTGYLGLLACLLDSPDSGDTSGLQTFDRIAPADNSLTDDINNAVATLSSIDKYDDKTPLKDVALQRLIARAFAISTIYQVIGANSENKKCNASGLSSTVDEIPDDFDPTVISTAQADQYIANLEGILVDADQAGLASDFELLQRSVDILNDVNDQGVSNRDALIASFNDAYASVEQQVCN